MKVKRHAGFEDENGKFSIWTVYFSQQELTKIALSNPEHLTYNPVELFRVTIKVANNKPTEISLYEPVSPDTESDAIIKTIRFIPVITKSDDGDITVEFNPSESVVKMNTDLSPTPLVYYFSYLNAEWHKTGSFYNLFNDIIKYGTFALVDGTALISDQLDFTDLYNKKVAIIRAKRDHIRSEKAKAVVAKKESKESKQHLEPKVIIDPDKKIKKKIIKKKTKI
jgi:hypothetical protein